MFRPAVSARMARSIIADGGALVWAAVSARRPAGHGGAAEVTNLGKLELGSYGRASGS